MWTPTTRQQHSRTITRYQTDLTDAEWRVIAPHLPKPFAARFRLPAVYPWRYFVAAGALMSYGIDNIDVLQKAASYVDRILRGAKPADLPAQAPTKYETAVNLTAAKAIGLTIPPTLLATADEVIE